MNTVYYTKTAKSTLKGHTSPLQKQAAVLLGIVTLAAIVGHFYFKSKVNIDLTAQDLSTRHASVAGKKLLKLPEAAAVTGPQQQAPTSSNSSGQEEVNKKELKLVKSWPDGTLVYQRAGMQVTVLPDGDLLYLPDEI